MTLRYLSVCSGIEAATQAWHPLGWEPVAFSEIEAFPSAVLAHHYPSVPNWGDMTKFQEWPDADVDVLCGGTPCQSFSVAGLRQGLADPRGNLMLTFGAIARRYDARWVVWENVPGVLSSNGGRDFAAFLGLLGQLGYGWAYRVLDAQHVRTRRFPFAVPQRRRRVFVVGYLGDWRRAAAVLFDRESLSGHPAPRREAGQRPAPTTSARPTGGGGLGTDFDLDGGLITLDAGFDVCGALSDGAHNGGGLNGQDAYTGRILPVAHALRGEGHDASEDGTRRGTPIITVAMAFDQAQITSKANRTRVAPELPASTLSSASDMCVAIQERAVSENPDAGPGGKGYSDEDAAYTLEARNKVQAVAFDAKGTQVQTDATGTAPTLRAMGHAGSHQNGGGQLAVAFAQNTRDEVRLIGGDGSIAGALAADPGAKQQAYVAFDMRGREGGDFLEGPHKTANIRAADGGSSRSYVAEPWAVRRLTPVECERLQGFPDGFTRIPYRGKPAENCPDGPRYKALGNSWAVNVADWVGERINQIETWESI